MNIILTANEQEVVDAIENWGGTSIWTECLQDEVGIAPASLPGVVSSLVKKGVVWCEGEGREATVTFTDRYLGYPQSRWI